MREFLNPILKGYDDFWSGYANLFHFDFQFGLTRRRLLTNAPALEQDRDALLADWDCIYQDFAAATEKLGCVY